MRKHWWLWFACPLAPAAVVGLLVVGVLFALMGAQASSSPNVPAGVVPAGTSGALLCATVARNAGITDTDDLVVATAVGLAESSCEPTRLNDNPATMDLSYGLWQINMFRSLGPARLVQYDLGSYDELWRAEVNARVMFVMSGGGANWGPWSTFANQSYRAKLAEARAAVETLAQGIPNAAPGTLVALPPQWCDPGIDCRLEATFAPGVAAMMRANPFGLRIASAYRSTVHQAELYARNCPGGRCEVVTARPGTSSHETGEAVDLAWPDGSGVEYGDAASNWLRVYGDGYGLYNLIGPSDPVHFSRTGR